MVVKRRDVVGRVALNALAIACVALMPLPAAPGNRFSQQDGRNTSRTATAAPGGMPAAWVARIRVCAAVK